MHKSIVAGVDIGGSHITAALVNMNSRSVIEHTWKRAPVNAQGSTAEIMEGWCNTINMCFTRAGIIPWRIGVAIPGPFDYEKGICFIKNQAKYDALYGLNIKEMLSEKLLVAKENISFVNDATSFLEGERFNGAATSCERVMGITLGTGFGSAINNGHHTRDANLWCAPFLGGIAEDYFSSRWFINRYFVMSGKKKQNVKEIIALIDTDSTVNLLLDEFANNLASYLLPIVKAEKIEMIVLGGNIANAYDYFSETLKKRLLEWIPKLKVEKNKLGEYASLIGAASSCSQRLVVMRIQ